jgi:hypothetical protein
VKLYSEATGNEIARTTAQQTAKWHRVEVAANLSGANAGLQCLGFFGTNNNGLSPDFNTGIISSTNLTTGTINIGSLTAAGAFNIWMDEFAGSSSNWVGPFLVNPPAGAVFPIGDVSIDPGFTIFGGDGLSPYTTVDSNSGDDNEYVIVPGFVKNWQWIVKMDRFTSAPASFNIRFTADNSYNSIATLQLMQGSVAVGQPQTFKLTPELFNGYVFNIPTADQTTLAAGNLSDIRIKIQITAS